MLLPLQKICECLVSHDIRRYFSFFDVFSIMNYIRNNPLRAHEGLAYDGQGLKPSEAKDGINFMREWVSFNVR